MFDSDLSAVPSEGVRAAERGPTADPPTAAPRQPPPPARPPQEAVIQKTLKQIEQKELQNRTPETTSKIRPQTGTQKNKRISFIRKN